MTLVFLQWEKLFFIFSQLWHSFKWWSYDEGDGICYDDDVGNGDNNTDDDGDNDIDYDDDDDDDWLQVSSFTAGLSLCGGGGPLGACDLSQWSALLYQVGWKLS